MLKLLPLGITSRLWGYINSIDLPLSVRKPILSAYVSTFGCDLSEAYIDDLTEYRSLSEFFRRSLKPGVRPIDNSINSVVVSEL
jgi:phosphatidylserine decarboxylase